MALAGKGSLGGELLPFFKPEEHVNDVAILFEPFAKRENVGQYKNDAAETRVTVFRSKDNLEQGVPFEVKKYTINSTKPIVESLLEKLEEDKNAAVIATVHAYRPKGAGKPTFVLREPSEDVYDAVAAYYEQREADRNAAKAAAPSFD